MEASFSRHSKPRKGVRMYKWLLKCGPKRPRSTICERWFLTEGQLIGRSRAAMLVIMPIGPAKIRDHKSVKTFTIVRGQTPLLSIVKQIVFWNRMVLLTFALTWKAELLRSHQKITSKASMTVLTYLSMSHQALSSSSNLAGWPCSTKNYLLRSHNSPTAKMETEWLQRRNKTWTRPHQRHSWSQSPKSLTRMAKVLAPLG